MEKAGISQIGQTIRGYRLEKFLGSEMMTLLYHAHTEELWLPPDVLIRLLPFPVNASEEVRAWFWTRFEREARGMVRLRHAGLFPLFGYGMHGTMAYLIMPFVQGETLSTRMQRQRRWELSEVFALLAQLATPLDMLHQRGFVHQFLNPAQIIFPNGQLPQIMALRLAQMVCLKGYEGKSEPVSGQPVHLRMLNGSYLGAAEYLAPEVVRGLAPDMRSDVYSLGILLFELLSGQVPFSGTDYLAVARKHLLETPPALHEVAPELPIALEIVVNRALHRDPRYRFQSAGELVAACTSVLHSRIMVSHFSLLGSLRTQYQALPALEYQPHERAQPELIAAPEILEPQTALAMDILPSSPGEMLADAWLNTPEELSSGPVRQPEVAPVGSGRAREVSETPLVPVSEALVSSW